MFEHTLIPNRPPATTIKYYDCCRQMTTETVYPFVFPPPAFERFRVGHVSPQRPYSKTLPYHQSLTRGSCDTLLVTTAWQSHCGGSINTNWCKSTMELLLPTFCNKPTLPDFDAALLNEAKLDLAEQAQNEKAALAVAAIEAASTWEAVTNRLRQIIEAMWHIKSGRFRKAATTMGYTGNLVRDSKRMASDRLEYAYMWAPTMGEVRGLAELAAEHVANVAAVPTKVVARKRAKYVNPAVPDITFSIPDLVQVYEDNPRDYTEQVASVWATLQQPQAVLRPLDQLGLINPLTVGWELIPFSFVIDQFIPIGNYLASFSAYAGWDVLDSGGSVQNTVTRKTKIKSSLGGSGDASYLSHEYDRFNFNDGEHGVLQPSFPLTSLAINQSFNRLINNIALGRLVLSKS